MLPTLFRKPAEKKQKKDAKASDIRKHLVRRDGTQQQSTIAEESDEEDKEKEGKVANLKNYKNFFRELDLDIWIMLSLPLTLNPAPENVNLVLVLLEEKKPKGYYQNFPSD